MQSKEFDSLVRPTLDLTATIAHGHSVTLALSDVNVAKDSSFAAEMILHSLDKLVASGLDLRKVSLHIQADNTVREVKNNTTMRLAGALVASHRVHDISICHLISGHSHEDVDALFGGLTTLIEATPELHSPEDFRLCLEGYLSDPTVRPHEASRSVIVVGSCRDWPFDL